MKLLPLKRAITLVHLGQAGIQLGSECWKIFASEHGVLSNGFLRDKKGQNCSDNYRVLFDEATSGQLIPRSIFADTTPYAINTLSNNRYGDIFKCDRMIYDVDGTGGIYSRGCILVREMFETIENKIRCVAESCNSNAGFLIFHSIGGGTGSSFSAFIMTMLTDQFPKVSKIEFTVYPSSRLSSTIVEPYNAILGNHQTIDHSNCAFMFDNEAVLDVCSNKFDLDYTNFLHLNEVIALVLTNVTSELGSNASEGVGIGGNHLKFRELETNLVPFPRMHFPMIAYSPLDTTVSNEENTIFQITEDCFNSNNQMMKCKPSEGLYMACCFLYRGTAITPNMVYEAIHRLKSKRQFRFVNWCPAGFKISINSTAMPHPFLDNSFASTLCVLSNNTIAIEPWIRLSYKFDLMFAKRAYIHWFEVEGTESDEFLEARENIAALEKDYEICHAYDGPN